MPVSGGVELAFATIAGHLASLALPIMAMQLYDRLLLPHQPGTLPLLAFCACMALLLENIVMQLRAKLMALAGASYEHQSEKRLFNYLLRAKAQIQSEASTGPIGQDLQLFQHLQRCKRQAGGEAWIIGAELCFTLLYIGIIGWLALPLGEIVATLGLLFAVIALLAGVTLKKQMIKRHSMENMRLNIFWEILQQWHAIKAMTLEALTQRRLETLHLVSSRIAEKISYTIACLSSINGLAAQATMLAVVLAGTPHVLDGSISAGTLIACVMLSGRVMPPLQHAVNGWLHAQETNNAREALQKTLKPERYERPLQPEAEMENPSRLQGQVLCQGVGFQYGKNETPILKQLDLHVEPGESIAIVGGHSSGKTTFMKLLAGLLAPSEGKVQIDNISPAHCGETTLPKLVGYVSSEGSVLRGSIMENMCAFNPSLQNNARELASLLGLDHIAARLPQGYNTMLTGEIADVVPPGVKQRIAMVRALVHKPKTILLDHADRALDPAGYNAAFRLLGMLKGKATLIMVTDDKNLIRLADSVYRMEDGRLERYVNTPNLIVMDGGKAA